MIGQDQAWQWAASRLSPERLAHTRGVVASATELAVRSGVDPEKAAIAAILHDSAKNLGPAELLSLAASAGIIVNIVQQQAPDLLHGPVAAVLASRELGVADEAVLQAIARHTTGAPGMTELDKVLYLADYIEPGRSFPGVAELRQVARVDLDRAVLLAMDGTLRYVIERGWLIDPLTVEARNWLIGRLRQSGKGDAV